MHSHEVSMIKNFFEENEINYQVPDEIMDKSSGIAGLGIRGMRVQVIEDQKEKAVTILRERGFSV